MGEITQESHFEMLEKLPDGNFKIKYPKVKSKSGVTFDEHLADNAAHDKMMVTGEYVGDGTSSKKIVLGFKPNIVILYRLNSDGYPISVHYRHGGYGYRLESGTSSRYTGASPAGYKYITPLIADDGFEVEYRDDLSDTNSANYNYVYMAIK